MKLMINDKEHVMILIEMCGEKINYLVEKSALTKVVEQLNRNEEDILPTFLKSGVLIAVDTFLVDIKISIREKNKRKIIF